ncbi:MAG: hypothetical protein NTU76_01790 [Candidatus Taylorbacteria bacterium]|nr:hypothetical protein [Candidatus Taylorbacteria bacterium]
MGQFYTNKIKVAIHLAQQTFSQFDEIWLIGLRSNHIDNLKNLGILEKFSNKLTLLYTYLDFGDLAQYRITPLPKGNSSYKKVLFALNPEVCLHLRRIVNEKKRVCIFTPLPNGTLNEYIKKEGACKFTKITSSIDNIDIFLFVESKLNLNMILQTENKEINRYIIPSIIPNKDIGEYKYLFDTKNFGESGLCIQKAISAKSELDRLKLSDGWKDSFKKKEIKISQYVPNTYPANGSGCIVPVSNKMCRVYIDNLSKKILDEKNSSFGNDWSRPWEPNILKQYVSSMMYVGRKLYEKFKYTGLFGVDYIVIGNKSKYSYLLITEINPRWQGTTIYQTINALKSNRVPLEIVHYIIKLNQTKKVLSKICKLMGSEESYNKQSVAKDGIFYLKLKSPKNNFGINIQGEYLFTGKELIESNLEKSNKGCKKKNFQINRLDIVNIKYPPKKTDLNKGIGPVGIVFGNSSKPVFSSKKPAFTHFGKKLYELVNNLINTK